MSVGEIVITAKFNNVAQKLRAARDKYYAGYAVVEDVGNGTAITASSMNSLASQLLEVTNKSPIRFTYEINVTAGEIIKDIINNNLQTAYNNINSVANCYTNCHSNCYSNCYSNCKSSSGCGNSR